MCDSKVRSQLDGSFVCDHGFLQSVRLLQRAAQIAVAVSEKRTQPDGFSVVCDSCVYLTLVLENSSNVIPTYRKVGPDTYGFQVTSFRALQITFEEGREDVG